MNDLRIPLIEPYAVQSDFADGLATVEIDKHGNGRIVFYAEQREVMSGDLEHQVVARLIIPRDAMVEAATRMLAAASGAGPSLVRVDEIRSVN